jgi:hypothetical protein
MSQTPEHRKIIENFLLTYGLDKLTEEMCRSGCLSENVQMQKDAQHVKELTGLDPFSMLRTSTFAKSPGFKELVPIIQDAKEDAMLSKLDTVQLH